MSGTGPEGLGLVMSKKETTFSCKEDADFQSLKSAMKGNGNVLNVGLTGSFSHLSITG